MNSIVSISIWLHVKLSKGIIHNFVLRVPPLYESRSGMCSSETGFIISYHFCSNSPYQADIFRFIFKGACSRFHLFLSLILWTDFFSLQLIYVVSRFISRLSLETYETQQCNPFEWFSCDFSPMLALCHISNGDSWYYNEKVGMSAQKCQVLCLFTNAVWHAGTEVSLNWPIYSPITSG